MIVLIPLGGLGERFRSCGYTLPKPLIKVMGITIIEWLLNTLNVAAIQKIVIPYCAQLSCYRFEDGLHKRYPTLPFHFVPLSEQTRGAAQSVLIGLESLIIADCPVLCLDGDNFYTCNVIQKWSGINCVFYFNDTGEVPKYSYLQMENNRVTGIVEKKRISNYASSGAYGFLSFKQLIVYCKRLVAENRTSEIYLSDAIQLMIEENQSFEAISVPANNHFCLGTPLDVRIFCNDYTQIVQFMKAGYLKKQTYCFDLDNTLVTFPKIPGDYTSVQPIVPAIDFLKLLKMYGHKIIIYTARQMDSNGGDVGRVMATVGKITLNTLEMYDIPYDGLYFGKPVADYYIDDLAISSFSDLQKEMGYYHSNINTRSFNQLSDGTIATYTKTGTDMKGEIYWYTHIPHTLKNLFPAYYGCTANSYTIEKLNAIPLSRLYLSEDLTFDHLTMIVHNLTLIHSTPIPPDEPECTSIYFNYLPKLENRYAAFNYNNLAHSDNMYIQLRDHLDGYEKLNRGKMGVIHGDPVLTNILMDKNGCIKFIDMRGLNGSVYTLVGDLFYDWAKLYQSLLGYDEILFHQKINLSYKHRLVNFFKTWFITTFGEHQFNHLQYLTASLFFTLIPLHELSKATSYLQIVGQLIGFKK